MKKQILFMLSALALAFTACDDKEDLGIPQVNPQEPIVPATGWVVNLVSPMSSATTLDLDQYAGSPNTIIPIATCEMPAEIPANSTVSMRMEIGADNSFSPSVIVDLIDDNGVYGIMAEDWNASFRQLLGRTPDAHENNFRIAVYVNTGSQVCRVGNSDTWYAPKMLEVTPIDMGIPADTAYYILISSSGTGDVKSAVKMEHDDSYNQYDNTVYSYAADLPVNADGFQWWIIPESSYELNTMEGAYAPISGSVYSGDLVMNGEPDDVEIGGFYMFSINMYPDTADHTPTYSITLAVPQLYVPGQGNHNSFDNNWLTTYNYSEYFGFVHLDGSFRLTDRPSRDGMVWGKGDENNSIKLNGGNIPGPSKGGLYWMNVNLASLTYSWIQIEGIGIVGSFNEEFQFDSEDCYVTLTQDPSSVFIWTGEITFTDPNTEWKIKTNTLNQSTGKVEWGWNPNLGYRFEEDPFSDLVNNGGNLPVPPQGIGTYNLTLDLTIIPYKCELIKID